MILSPPYLTLFSLTLMTSTVLALSASNWLMLWASLELNMLAFIPIISSDTQSNTSDPTIKYFITQAIGSATLLMAATLSTPSACTTTPMMLLALLLKMGAAPLHFWFPSVAASVSWASLALLSTWQKIAPLFILTSTSSHHFLLPLIGLLGVLVGGVGGLGQVKYRSIIAFSSIANLGWTISIAQWRLPAVLFFLAYTINILPLIAVLHKCNHHSPSSSSLPPNLTLASSVLLISLAGLPPTMGFIPKWLTIQILASAYTPLIPYLMTLASLPTVFFYLSFVLSIQQSQTSTQARTQYHNLLASTAIFALFLANPLFVLAPAISLL